MFGFDSKKSPKIPIVTSTSEPVQPVRLHYTVLNRSQVLSKLHSLHCMGENIANRRFQWHFSHETKKGPVVFEPKQKPNNVIALGFVFLSEDGKSLMVRVLSAARAVFALQFFDHYFSRKHLRVENMDLYTRILESSPADQEMVKNSDLLFPEEKIHVKDTKTLPMLMERWAAANLAPEETLKAVYSYIAGEDKLLLPEIENSPVDFYENGIDAVRIKLMLHEIVAFEHLNGNTDFRVTHAIEKVTGGKLRY